MSTAYYDANSARFFADTVTADMSDARSRFLTYVPADGAVLDAGCGSGRDSLAFKNLGYAVTACDGSAEMVRLATAHAQLAVLHKQFHDIDWHAAFDGIWTCASLLHVPRAQLPDVLARLARALRPGGVWFLSFKYGSDERWTGKRHFTDMDEPLLRAAIAAAGLTVTDLWLSDDVRPDHIGPQWVSALARKPL